MNNAHDNRVIRREDTYFGCPAESMWTSDELQDENKRKCYICAKVCQKVVHRIFYRNEVRNFCSLECFESD